MKIQSYSERPKRINCLRSVRRWEDYVKADLKEMGFNCVATQFVFCAESVNWLALVNTVMNFL
jgi:hypothetical protein